MGLRYSSKVKAKELNDTESMEKLENLKIDIWVSGENNELGKNMTWCLKDEL